VGINTTIGATSLRPKNGLNWQWDAGSNPALSSQKTIMFPYLEKDGFFCAQLLSYNLHIYR